MRGGKRKMASGLEAPEKEPREKFRKTRATEDEDLEARFGSEVTALYQLNTKAAPYETHCTPTETPSQAHLQQQTAKTNRDNASDDSNATPEDTWTPPSGQTTSTTLQQSQSTANPTKNSHPPQIFRNLTIYINGSTYPLISDHKLKRLLVQHGANLSISLGRRSVTHVILGSPNSRESSIRANDNNGAGGGLASSKIQKEIAKSLGRGASVKYVGADWVLESLKRGARAPEWKFEVLRCAGERQKSVVGLFGKESGNTASGA